MAPIVAEPIVLVLLVDAAGEPRGSLREALEEAVSTEAAAENAHTGS